VEVGDRESTPEPGGGNRSETVEFEAPDHVAHRLARVGDVPIDLGFHTGAGERGVVVEEVDGVLSGPSLGVDAGVDDEAAGAKRVSSEHADALQRRCVEAHLVGEAFRVQAPAFAVGSDLEFAEDRVQVQFLSERELQVVAGNGLVERSWSQREASPQLRVTRIEVERTIAAAVG
jgi:hypothetical protein